MVCVVLDTSALLSIEEYKVDIFDEVKKELSSKAVFIIPYSLLEELKRLSKIKGKKGIKARVALLFLEKYSKDIVFFSPKKEDEEKLRKFFPLADYHALLSSFLNDCYLFTLDKKLLKKARALNLPLLSWKGKLEIL